MSTKRLLIFSVFTLLFLNQCGDFSKKNLCESRKLENNMKIELDSNKLYFPLKTDTNVFIFGISVNKWYSEMLYALNEPVLFEKSKKGEKIIYRFTWLRTRYNPIAIRVEKDKSKYTLFCKVTDGQGGYSPGKLVVNIRGEITEQEWNEFQGLLKQADFWSMPITTDDSGKDGSEWILEGVENDRYHVVSRWSPKNSAFRNCCEYLLGRTNLKIADKEKY